MRERFVLFLTDDEIILYKGSLKEIYPLAEGIPHIQTNLQNVLSRTPKASLSVLIDRNHQDVREELLPALLPWDRMGLLAHKREEWTSQGAFHGYQFFKQDGQSFLQWVNISQNDSLVPWLSWIKSLPHPLWGVYFVSLEVGRFLKKHFPLSNKYHLFFYKINSHKIRYVIFKNKQLLFCRPFSGEEDLRTSLHFLNRTYPDIHEKLQVSTLINDIPLTFPHVTTLPNPHGLVDFLIQQKGGVLSLKIKPSAQHQWRKKGIGLICLGSLVLTGLIVYQCLQYKQKTVIIFSKISALKNQIQNRKALLKNRDMERLRSALDHYDHLKSQIRSPLNTFEKLSHHLEKHPLCLQHLSWKSEDTTSLEISFFMQNDRQNALANRFESILASLTKIFPHTPIQIIEAPLKSGSHETYQYPPSPVLPIAHLRMTEP